MTQWNKPRDLHPWDFNPNYVAHISFSGVPYGKAMAETLIKAMGGKGGIVALGGIESNVPAIERKAGLEQALKEHPDVKLLDLQVANWQATVALEKTNAWLTQFGDKIGGIWAANDDMALAAVEALRADGRAGKVPVTGIDGTKLAVEAVLKGEMAGTVAWDPYWQGGMGLSIGYHAKTGAFDPAKEPKDHREFYGKGVIVTSGNAEEYYDANIKSEPKMDWNDIWGRVTGQDSIQLTPEMNGGARPHPPAPFGLGRQPFRRLSRLARLQRSCWLLLRPLGAEPPAELCPAGLARCASERFSIPCRALGSTGTA